VSSHDAGYQGGAFSRSRVALLRPIVRSALIAPSHFQGQFKITGKKVRISIPRTPNNQCVTVLCFFILALACQNVNIREEFSSVSDRAIYALGQVFGELPEKSQVWQELHD